MTQKRPRSIDRTMMVGRLRMSTLAGLALATGSCAGPTADVQEPEMGAVVVTQWNDSTELFLEYPHPVAGQQTGNWAIHLSDMEDFQPIRSGRLTVTFTSEENQVETFVVEAPAPPTLPWPDQLLQHPDHRLVETDAFRLGPPLDGFANLCGDVSQGNGVHAVLSCASRSASF